MFIFIILLINNLIFSYYFINYFSKHDLNYEFLIHVHFLIPFYIFQNYLNSN